MSGIFNFWNARYTTDVRYSPESALVTTKEQRSTPTTVSLREFLERRCPSLHAEFRPAWWLSKYVKSVSIAHISRSFKYSSAAICRLSIVSSETSQTETRLCITGDYIQAKKFDNVDTIIQDLSPSARWWNSVSSFQLLQRFFSTMCLMTTIRGLDFTPVDNTHLPPETPIIVVMHGLTGGMQYIYTARI